MDPGLYKAAMEGDIKVLREHKDQLCHQFTRRSNTVLHVAAQFQDNKECVKEMLILQPSLLRKVNSKGETALHIAAKRGCRDTVEELLAFAKKLADLESNVAVTKELLRMPTLEEKDTALHEAVRNNHLGVVELLLEEDPDLSYAAANSAGETPLYLAAERHYHEIVSAILGGSCRNQAYGGPNGRTALHAAVIAECSNCVEMIHDKKPDLIKKADSCGWTPLHFAARFSFDAQVKQLLKMDKSTAYDVDKDDEMTPLHLTAKWGSAVTMQKLLSKCPDCWEIVNKRGQNILHIAIQSENAGVIKFLLQNSPLISNLLSEKDQDGNTPLHILAASNCDIPELIGHPAADKGAFNKKNHTPRDVASIDACRSNEAYSIKEALIKANAKLGSRNIVLEDKNRFENWKKARLPDTNGIKEQSSKGLDTTIIVVGLTASVTFAAGFTLRAGYEGPNEVIRRAAFKAFVIFNTVAVTFSICALFLFVISHYYAVERKKDIRVGFGFFFTLIALGATAVSFITGSFAVLATSLGFRLVVCVIGCFPFLVYYISLRKLFRDYISDPTC
ncbi:ankyrin repeat-containing protein At5g02620-like [Diospyros lotus]|uniref:ankyrin repeat-containing protein At5g02620-like n=1 Tax=Diospyros lotus TaxID=55363 RepID=UPI002255F939|nr:ankyrin repeat-containing protein At5g02620-like [Diospyros lotus]